MVLVVMLTVSCGCRCFIMVLEVMLALEPIMVLVVMLTVSWGCSCYGIGSNVNCIMGLQV